MSSLFFASYNVKVLFFLEALHGVRGLEYNFILFKGNLEQMGVETHLESIIPYPFSILAPALLLLLPTPRRLPGAPSGSLVSRSRMAWGRWA